MKAGSSDSWAPNGAGKTTTLRMLLGLANPTSGSSTVHGQPFVSLADPVHTVGAVLDGGMLHPGRSGRNHLRVLARAAGIGNARVDELLEFVALKTPRTGGPADTRRHAPAARPRGRAAR